LKRFTSDDPHLTAVEALAGDPGKLSPEQQAELHFALGKIYADVGRHEQSFTHLLEGNRWARKHFTYDEPEALQLFERIRAVFSPELMRTNAGLGDPTDAPVFIIGMPRSGSTLVEQILASHPLVWAGGELDHFQEALARLQGVEGTASAYPEVVPFMTAEDFRTLGANYHVAIAASTSGAQRITDKLPVNFLLAGLIPLALPNARIIHTRRNPVDTCLSCFSKRFPQQPYTNDLAELGRYYRAYEGLMEHWRPLLPPGVMLEVDYEELVADFEAQARRIIAHCGLPWNEACLDFHSTGRPVVTASSAQVRQPLYRSSIGRSQPYLPLLKPLLDALAGHG
jgi:hypothetical protein